MNKILLTLLFALILTSCSKPSEEGDQDLFIPVPTEDVGNVTELPDEITPPVEAIPSEENEEDSPVDLPDEQSPDEGDDMPVTVDPIIEEEIPACEFKIERDSYYQGYVATLKIRNNKKDMNNWKLEFSMPEGQRIVHYWNIDLSDHKSYIKVKALKYNKKVERGEFLEFGIEVNHKEIDDPRNISHLELNKEKCTRLPSIK